MLGDLIYEHKGKVTGQRVLNVSPPRVETSFSNIGTLKGGITVSEIGTVLERSKISRNTVWRSTRHNHDE